MNNKIRIEKYFKSEEYVVTILTTILIFLLTYFFIKFLAIDYLLRDKEPYNKNDMIMWYEWYEIYSESEHQLIDFRKPYVFDYSINNKYKYEKSYDEIVEEYKKILEKENWQFLQKDENSITYVKDGLLFSIIKLPDGFLQTKVWLKCDME